MFLGMRDGCICLRIMSSSELSYKRCSRANCDQTAVMDLPRSLLLLITSYQNDSSDLQSKHIILK